MGQKRIKSVHNLVLGEEDIYTLTQIETEHRYSARVKVGTIKLSFYLWAMFDQPKEQILNTHTNTV